MTKKEYAKREIIGNRLMAELTSDKPSVAIVLNEQRLTQLIGWLKSAVCGGTEREEFMDDLEELHDAAFPNNS